MAEPVVGHAAVPAHVAPVGPHAFLPGRPVSLVSVVGMIVDRAAHGGLLITNISTDHESYAVLIQTPAPEDVRAWARHMSGSTPACVRGPSEIITTSRAEIGQWQITFRSVLTTQNGGN